MWLQWLHQRIDDRVDAVLIDRVELLLEDARRRFIKSIPISETFDSIILDKRKSYTILETETDKPETINGAINCSKMKEGDKIEIDFLIRISPEGGWVRWEQEVIEGNPKNPALSIEGMLAPCGSKIVMTHRNGNDIDISWYVARSRL